MSHHVEGRSKLDVRNYYENTSLFIKTSVYQCITQYIVSVIFWCRFNAFFIPFIEMKSSNTDVWHYIRFKQSCMTQTIQNNWLIKQNTTTMNAEGNVEIVYRHLYHHIMGYELWCLTSLITFTNISAISWRSVVLVSQVIDKQYHIMLYRIHRAMGGIQSHYCSGDRHWLNR